MSQAARALDERIACHRPDLARLARLSLGRRWPEISPSDVVGDTIQQALAKQEQFRGPDVLVWLRGILRHRLLDRIRRAIVRREHEKDLDRSSSWIGGILLDPQPSPSSDAVRHEEDATRQKEVRRLAEALDQLPDKEGTVVELLYWYEWTQAEVAELLGCTRPAVAGLLRRALQRMRKLLDNRE